MSLKEKIDSINAASPKVISDLGTLAFGMSAGAYDLCVKASANLLQYGTILGLAAGLATAMVYMKNLRGYPK